MDENLLGYLLESLDDGDNRQTEAHLHASPEARGKLTVLKRALGPLAIDRDEVVPPLGLAERTLARIDAIDRDLPRAPREPSAVATCRGGWRRRIEVMVAAALVVLVLGASFPLVYRWHRQRGTIDCQENMRQFFVALSTYGDQKGSYPDVTQEAPRNVAGMVVPVLADAGVLPASFSVRCPEVGSHLGCAWTLAQMRSMSEEDFRVQAPNLALCYAFALGYRDFAGEYHGPWQVPAASWPILADRPPSDGSPGNSANHGGAGQNVLFLDGHFRFVPQRTLGNPDDDIFLNNDQRVAAGIGARDIVLGCSSARP